jgi:5'-nucleotidase
MRILLTNDDGINAPGLAVLEDIAREISDDVWIAAPEEEQSGKGRAISLTHPVRTREVATRPGPWRARRPTASCWRRTI